MHNCSKSKNFNNKIKTEKKMAKEKLVDRYTQEILPEEHCCDLAKF
jgi:hypothetical protein